MDRWRHCVGTLHPADLSSKGKSLSEFVNNRQWINGPEWLLTIEEGSPDEEFSMHRECLTELKKNQIPTPALLSHQDGMIGVSHLIEV